MAKHRFVLVGLNTQSGWWLKVTSPEELLAYHAQHDHQYARAFQNLLVDTKPIASLPDSSLPHPELRQLSAAIYTHAQVHELSIVEATARLGDFVTRRQLESIAYKGCIYINDRGGWCEILPSKIRQFLDKESFSFPHFTIEDIRITQFDNGTHYYAYIGPMQVRDGDILKWDTREEAYNQALACIQTTT